MSFERPSADEQFRLAQLRSLGLIDLGRQPGLDALVDCAARMMGCAAAAVSLVDADKVWLQAVHGLASAVLPRAEAMCSHTIAEDGVLEVPDLCTDPRSQSAHALAHDGWRMYAGVPLRVDGAKVGALFVLDREIRRLAPDQHRALSQLGEVAAGLLQGASRLASAQRERARLTDFARASGDWMWEVDADLRYTWVSGAFEAVTGIPPTRVIGQPVMNAPLLDPVGNPLPDGSGLRDLLEKRQVVTRALTAKPTARGVLQVSRSAVPTFDAAGRFTGYRGTARDVSAHVTGERQSRGQAELLRKLSSQVPGVIFQFRVMPDRSLQHLYASDACRAMFGVEPPGATDGADSAAVCRALHPADRHGVLQSLVEAGAEQRPWYRECRTLREGQVRWLELRAMPEARAHGEVLWHGFAADVTARKEIELALRHGDQRWAMAAQAARIGIAQFERATGRIVLDPIACANHGLPETTGELQLDDWLATLLPEDRASASHAVVQAFRTLGSIEARYRVPSPDGNARTLEVFAHCVLDDRGRATGMLGTCRDVTQQVAHEQLRRDKETAERASQAKSEFLSRVSHELRTPLNGILGFAQLMALDRLHPLAPAQARRLDSVMHAGRHLLELINEVLDLARIEQGEFRLERAPVDVSASLRASVALIQPLADDAGVRVHLPDTGPVWAEADPRGVEQVLINLLSNAIKYNRPQGQVRITLRRDGGRVAASVTDEGAGLTAAQQAHLFEPFNRLGAEQQRVEGTGLGLVIARSLAVAMGGGLAFSSAVPSGCTFTLELPEASEPDAGAARRAPPANDAEAVDAGRRRVLYIEDEPLNQLLMRELFRSRPQWELEVAGDGREGLERLDGHAFDLVLIDMNLPDMSGLDLIRHLRARPATRALHCIALSADAMQSQIDAAVAAGYNAYWTKPINVPQVLEGLARVLA